jgi:hypothetical protein
MANAATDLDLEILGDGAPSVLIAEGTASVDVEIYAQLVGDLDPPDGLALIGFDLSETGGLTLAENWLTAGPSMGSFVKTAGLTNPNGYGGTLVAGVLLQIGGGQNTIGNTGAAPDYPIGTVVPDIGNTQVLVAEATLDTSSLLQGTYTLTLDNPFANVIDDYDGTPEAPYSVSPADGYTYTNQTLTIVVGPGGDPPEITGMWYSIANHGTTLGDLAKPFDPAATGVPDPWEDLDPLLNINGVGVETRQGSITTLEVTFTEVMDPLTITTGAITVQGNKSGPYHPTSVALSGGDTVLTMTFPAVGTAGSLPNGQLGTEADHYTACIATSVQSLAGLALIGDVDCEFYAQFGNVWATGPSRYKTNPVDRTNVNSRYSLTPPADVAMNYDVWNKGPSAGKINPVDRTNVNANYTAVGAEPTVTVPACP